MSHVFSPGDAVVYKGIIVTVTQVLRHRGLCSAYIQIQYPDGSLLGVPHSQLTLFSPATTATQAVLFSIGDKVKYQGAVYEVTDSFYDPHSGETYHDIAGTVVYSLLSGIASKDLTKYVPVPPEWAPPDKLETKSTNPCECGAHITTYKDDHMYFCPLFKGVK